MNIIETQNLTKSYSGFTAVSGINLHIPKGTVYGFLGPNGAGKSTTMKMFLGSGCVAVIVEASAEKSTVTGAAEAEGASVLDEAAAKGCAVAPATVTAGGLDGCASAKAVSSRGVSREASVSASPESTA